MKRCLLWLAVVLVLLLAAAQVLAQPAHERAVTFTFTEIWLDEESTYEEDGVLYADGYLVVEASALSELTLADLPLRGSGQGGILSIESLEMHYLDEEKLAELDPDGEYGFDESCVELSGTFHLDAAAVQQVLGLDPEAVEEQWEEQAEAIVEHWLAAVYDAYYAIGADLAYGDGLYLSEDDGGIVDLTLTGDGAGGAYVELFCVSWGLDALLGRLFESWTNVGYWFYDFYLEGEIREESSDLYFETCVSYLLYEHYYPYPDNYTCWIWEGYSLLPPTEEAAELLGFDDAYLEYVTAYEAIPKAWILREGESIILHIPESWHPKPWWEPYGPRDLAADPDGQASGSNYSSGKVAIKYNWKKNTLQFDGPLNMEQWARRHNLVYWEEAAGLPSGLPYAEIAAGPHSFIKNRHFITGLIVFLYGLVITAIIFGLVSVKRIPRQMDI